MATGDQSLVELDNNAIQSLNLLFLSWIILKPRETSLLFTSLKIIERSASPPLIHFPHFPLLFSSVKHPQLTDGFATTWCYTPLTGWEINSASSNSPLLFSFSHSQCPPGHKAHTAHNQYKYFVAFSTFQRSCELGSSRISNTHHLFAVI